MTLLDDDLRAELQAAARRMELLETLRQDRPSEFYEPHERGQAQFHAAPHIVRAMFPGNGFGKTRAAGTEANWWLTHRYPPRAAGVERRSARASRRGHHACGPSHRGRCMRCRGGL